MTEEQLKSSLSLRIMDIFGVYTRDMPDVRTLMYKNDNIFAGAYNVSAKEKITFIYKEIADNKYAHLAFYMDKVVYNYIIANCDSKEEDPGLNNVYIHLVSKGENIYREAKIIEIASLFKSTELLRQLFSNWDTNNDFAINLKALNEFIKSIKVEEKEE